jgi:uncharacterized membrane protein
VPAFKQLPLIRPRVLLAITVGVMASVLLPVRLRPIPCALIGWNCGAWIYLFLAWWKMGTSSSDDVSTTAVKEDESATAVISVLAFAAIASSVAVVVELTAAKIHGGTGALFDYGLTVATMLSAWMITPTIFALHYARCYYANPMEPSLGFPRESFNPNYWDFLYFSITIAVAFQTSDVALHSAPLRRAVLVQSITSFFFNMAVLGLFVNIAAGLISS